MEARIKPGYPIMSGKPSADMKKAIRLLRRGMEPKQAAHCAGVHITSIYRSKLYKALIAMRKSKDSANKG